jgi:hypothetical protein
MNSWGTCKFARAWRAAGRWLGTCLDLTAVDADKAALEEEVRLLLQGPL